uniref:Ribonuclease H protein At1g65750 family n=1 Tax=Cajanus cajan TaxID=3821 RepID=A0A151U1X2_CAJCA|nr:Putative ribonuclease H protein At1g65750 family [Cajanus cajan]
MDFPLKWRKWIAECVSTTRIFVLLNGSPTGEFGVGKGLRQGDPLAPFLFLIVAEGLNALMSKAVERHVLSGYSVGHQSVNVSHLQYADDTLIIGGASSHNVWAIKSILQIFELVAGLKVNFHKSKLFGFNINIEVLNLMAQFLNCKVGSLPFCYLGLPLGANPHCIKTWEPVISKVKKRLSKWKSSTLSFGGRSVLLKSVLNSIPTYYLSFFKAPQGIISKLESLFKLFLWGGDENHRKIAWVAWQEVCRGKEHGGLGILDLRAFNLALLKKWR